MRRLLLAAAVALCLGWLYGGDAAILVRLGQPGWAALATQPSLWLTALGLAILALGLGATVFGLATRKAPSWKPFLVLPVGGLAVLLVDLALLAPARPGVPVETLARDAVATVSEQLGSTAVAGRIPVDGRHLQDQLKVLGAPPYFHDGVQLPDWLVLVRRDCSGPLAVGADARPGAVLVCLAPDEATAWVSVVSLDGRFGTPVARASDDWVSVVHAPVARRPPPPPPRSVWETDPPEPHDGG